MAWWVLGAGTFAPHLETQWRRPSPPPCRSACRVLQATGSQYLANLDYSLQTFLALHPDRHSLLGSPALRANILALQLSVSCGGRRQGGGRSGTLSCMEQQRAHGSCRPLQPPVPARLPALTPQLLQRSDWRMLLLDDAELRQALGDLQQQPSFAELCRFVLGCARSGATPLGTHGHSPKAALRYGGQGAAAAPRPQQRSALGSAESNSARSCAGDSAPSDAGGWQPAANAAAPARQHRGALPLQPANRR